MRTQCDACEWEGPIEACRTLEEMYRKDDRFFERLDAGSIVPHGECPKCKCFVYAEPIDTTKVVLQARNQELFETLEEILSHFPNIKSLERVDDDDMTGDRLCPMKDHVKISDIRRWINELKEEG